MNRDGGKFYFNKESTKKFYSSARTELQREGGK